MRKSSVLLTLIVMFFIIFGPKVQAQPPNTELITISQDHLVIQPLEKGVGIREILNITNSGNEPYLGATSDASDPGRKGWLFPLPLGFTNLATDIFTDEDYQIVKEGILVYKPLAPGSTSLVLSYTIPAENLPVTLTKNVSYPTKSLFVVSPQSLTISSDTLQPGDPFEIENSIYQGYSAPNLTQGQSLKYTIDKGEGTASAGRRIASGYAVPGHPQSHIALFNAEPLVYTNPHLWAGYLIIIMGLGLTAIILWGRVRRNAFQEQPTSNSQSLASTSEGEDEEEAFLRLKRINDTLLAELKSLDSRFARGEIPEEMYQDLRKKKKEHLIQVKIRLKDIIGR